MWCWRRMECLRNWLIFYFSLFLLQHPSFSPLTFRNWWGHLFVRLQDYCIWCRAVGYLSNEHIQVVSLEDLHPHIAVRSPILRWVPDQLCWGKVLTGTWSVSTIFGSWTHTQPYHIVRKDALPQIRIGTLTYFDEEISDVSGCLGRCFHVNNVAIFCILLGLLRLNFSLAFHISLIPCEGYDNMRISPPLQLFYPRFSTIKRILIFESCYVEWIFHQDIWWPLKVMFIYQNSGKRSILEMEWCTIGTFDKTDYCTW